MLEAQKLTRGRRPRGVNVCFFPIMEVHGPTGAVQLKQLALDYSQQKHTTWADNYCSIKG